MVLLELLRHVVLRERRQWSGIVNAWAVYPRNSVANGLTVAAC